MKLVLIEGPAGSGKSTKLREMHKGSAGSILLEDGSCPTPAALRQFIVGEARDGCKSIYIDECGDSVIDNLQQFSEKGGRGLNVTVFAVRSA